MFVIRHIFHRVNKRWNRVLSYTHAWTHVDFWQQQKTDKNWITEDNKYTRRGFLQVDDNTWVFPVNQNAVLDFLKKYTGGSLRSIYLHVVSLTILAHLKDSYGKLETVSFLSPKYQSKAALHKMTQSDPNLDQFHNHVCMVAESVKVLEFALDTSMSDYGELLACFRKLKNLQRLTMTDVNLWRLPSDSFDELSQDLTEINFTVSLSHRRPFRSSCQLCDTLLPLLKLTKIKVFRISIDPTGWYRINIDEFLSGIAHKWKDLRLLALTGIHPPSDIVRSIMTSLTHLRELELYGRMVTDETVALIAEYLKMLTSLKLSNGTYTSSGIKALCGHPSIERLYLMQRNQRQLARDWVLAVYDVILSLSNITKVKLVGYRVIAIHAKEEIPVVSPSIQIEVQNTREFLPFID